MAVIVNTTEKQLGRSAVITDHRFGFIVDAYLTRTATRITLHIVAKASNASQYVATGTQIAIRASVNGVEKTTTVPAATFQPYTTGSNIANLTWSFTSDQATLVVVFYVYNGSITYNGQSYSIQTDQVSNQVVLPPISETMNVYFETTRINNNGITALHQTGSVFTNNFKLGATVCRQVDLRVLKSYVSSIPNVVRITDNNNDDKFVLYVDSVDDTNIDFYDFSLVDGMVKLNAHFDYSRYSTAQQIINGICTFKLIGSAPTMEYGGDIFLAYSEDISARDIVSWCAELNGCIARINGRGSLEFVPMVNSETPITVDVNTCKDFKLGEHHLIDRVYVELGTGTHYYPETTTNNTVYLNPNNQLITDSGEYTIDGIVQHIQSVISGFEFYSATTSMCEINQETLPADPISFELDDVSYPSIAQIDWDYNTKWFGGYSLEIETKAQQETQLKGDNISNQIKIIVDRETGTIVQEVNQLNNDLTQATSSLTQTAQELELRVGNTETSLSDSNSRISSMETVVNIQAGGVRISQGNQGAYVLFTDSGMQIYVNGTKTAWAEADGFSAFELMIGKANEQTKWHMRETNDGATLMFLRG